MAMTPDQVADALAAGPAQQHTSCTAGQTITLRPGTHVTWHSIPCIPWPSSERSSVDHTAPYPSSTSAYTSLDGGATTSDDTLSSPTISSSTMQSGPGASPGAPGSGTAIPSMTLATDSLSDSLASTFRTHPSLISPEPATDQHAELSSSLPETPGPISQLNQSLTSADAAIPSTSSTDGGDGGGSLSTGNEGPRSASGDTRVGEIVGSVLGVVALALGTLSALILVRRRMRARRTAPSAEFMDIARGRGGRAVGGDDVRIVDARARRDVAPFRMTAAAHFDGATTPSSGDKLVPLVRENSASVEDADESGPPATIPSGAPTSAGSLSLLENAWQVAEERGQYPRSESESFASAAEDSGFGDQGEDGGVREKGQSEYAFAL
ncbi:hypothetical protein BD414DRAFT_533586 [Trametes punicea]|nr:hypothetical protein BD414DRAFT_533586 [Trametes punicea]